jgi:hypothetical protein
MRTLRSFLIAATLAATSMIVFAPPADAVVCHEYSCCGDVVVLGKTILRIDGAT